MRRCILKTKTSNVTSIDERNPMLVYLSSLAPTGRRTMAGKLRRAIPLLEGVAWPDLRFQHVVTLRSKLSNEGLAPATVNATLCAVRGVARCAWHLGQMNAEDFQRLKAVRSVAGSRLLAGRALSRSEVAALLDACAVDESAAGARDAALIALLFGGGLRRAEVAALDLDDYDAESNAIRVRGKGDKERRAFLSESAAAALNDWVEVRGSKKGAVVVPIRKGGKIEHRRMTDQAIYAALLRRAAAARVRHFTPHDLRRTFAGDLLDAGADLPAVQRLLGHASVQTTAKYDRRDEQAAKRAASLLDLPYKGKKYTY
jgi:integrase